MKYAVGLPKQGVKQKIRTSTATRTAFAASGCPTQQGSNTNSRHVYRGHAEACEAASPSTATSAGCDGKPFHSTFPETNAPDTLYYM